MCLEKSINKMIEKLKAGKEQMQEENSSVKGKLRKVQDAYLLEGGIESISFLANGIKGKYLITDSPLILRVLPKEGSPIKIEVPAGYAFDGASIPSALRGLLGKKTDKKFRIAACFHDFLYEQTEIDRLFADEVFYLLLLEWEVPTWKAVTFFMGVRTLGFAFNR